jgi:hypothetical protein
VEPARDLLGLHAIFDMWCRMDLLRSALNDVSPFTGGQRDFNHVCLAAQQRSIIMLSGALAEFKVGWACLAWVVLAEGMLGCALSNVSPLTKTASHFACIACSVCMASCKQWQHRNCVGCTMMFSNSWALQRPTQYAVMQPQRTVRRKQNKRREKQAESVAV